MYTKKTLFNRHRSLTSLSLKNEIKVKESKKRMIYNPLSSITKLPSIVFRILSKIKLKNMKYLYCHSLKIRKQINFYVFKNTLSIINNYRNIGSRRKDRIRDKKTLNLIKKRTISLVKKWCTSNINRKSSNQSSIKRKRKQHQKKFKN